MRIETASVPEPPRAGMFSNARVHGDQFFISGMHAGSPDGPVGGDDAYAQADEAFRRVVELARACGAVADDIVVLRVYLTDMGDKAAVGRARGNHFSGDFPCSTLLEVSGLVEPGLKVEVEAQGIIGSSAESG